jgi:hypothetical protein
MQMLITLVVALAGLIVSVAVGLVAEEFLVGQIFRLFLRRQSPAHASEAKVGGAES